MKKLTVLLTTEGTYPYHQGGVSTWCDTLVKELDMVDYILYSVITDPFITQKFQMPKATQLFKVPLWGTEEPCEHLPTPFSLVYLQKKRTTDKVIKNLFLPLFKELILEMISPEKNPEHFGVILHQLYKYFQEYEYKETFKSELVWNHYKSFILEWMDDPALKLTQPDIYGLIQSLGWVYRFLNIINTSVPKAHVSHSSASAFCGIPCVIAKIEHKTPFLLTEHGVYLREQYLSLSKRNLPIFLNTFLIRFIHSINSLNFHYADQVSPVCHYNTRWETKFGVPQENIEVIYNGVDTNVFMEGKKAERLHPTVVTVARIDPIKDIISLIHTAAIVKKQIKNVKFIVYGSVSVQGYYEECKALVKKLQLEETVIFAGHSNNMVAAYHSGDVIALSSISEAFPYSVVEAMMTGKPVVATDVGGIREALGNTGFLVTPRKPEEFAQSIILLLNNANLRDSLGRDARERALNYFTLDKVKDHHLKTYIKLATHSFKQSPIMKEQKQTDSNQRLEWQKLHSERAYALMSNGFYKEAIEQFRLAINKEPESPAVFIYKTEIAKAYYQLGETEKATWQFEKLKEWGLNEPLRKAK
ncbi:GT4 family glycosyltransferase PelF [Bacillus sp. BRMEA1]|uniref:GT4 family glycosyltransferase PelF n=1 Tax=Neobacillus endophyticus TaxID=2738405 RepID=UPI001565795F|nr:GT4 family glycosyltransferase PelF [Neobacillus endophyticus]NRD77981.1 GT4 family glycosyltransferase PelF [Neobacillus endophyticus]